jgi:hypothetical protein
MKYRRNIFFLNIGFFVCTGLVLFIAAGCSFISSEGVSAVSITISGIPDSALQGGEKTPVGYSQVFGGAPAGVDSLHLEVSGDDMETITVDYDIDLLFQDIIILEVPAGTDRTISLDVYMDPASPSAFLTYTGSAVTDLVAGEMAQVNIAMHIYETKIVIPDRYGSILAQISDISGSNWVTLTADDISNTDIPNFTGNDLRPYDVDFDFQGRIYIANYVGFGSTDLENVIIRVDDITGSNALKFPDGESDSGVATLSVDKVNEQIYYYFSNNVLKRADLDGNNSLTFTIATDIQLIRGMYIAEDGYLYIAGQDHLGTPSTMKYDTSSETVVDSYTVNLDTPWDVLVKDSYVYVADYDSGATNNKIIRLTLDLEYVDELTQPTVSFNGPHRFLAISPRKFFVMDENENVSLSERIAAFDNIEGDNWETFDPSMIGESRFYFFSGC